MFKTRLLSGIIMVFLLLALVITGGERLLAGLFVVSLIGIYELNRIFHIEKSLPGYVSYGAAMLFYLGIKSSGMIENIGLFLFIMVFLIVLMGVYVFTFPKYKTAQIMAAFFGVFYIAFMLSCIYLTRMLENGAFLVWLIFLCSWGCDTCAYCVGMLIGKHKMAPALSPKKSVEGAVGGFLGAVLLTILYGFLIREISGCSMETIFVMAGISGVGSLISMVGDLAASAMKRNYEIKDYGNLIPGHGGILDRFDSVIFTAPVIYFLAVYLI